jgi:hypothetical protein
MVNRKINSLAELGYHVITGDLFDEDTDIDIEEEDY